MRALAAGPVTCTPVPVLKMFVSESMVTLTAPVASSIKSTSPDQSALASSTNTPVVALLIFDPLIVKLLAAFEKAVAYDA